MIMSKNHETLTHNLTVEPTGKERHGCQLAAILEAVEAGYGQAAAGLELGHASDAAGSRMGSVSSELGQLQRRPWVPASL